MGCDIYQNFISIKNTVDINQSAHIAASHQLNHFSPVPVTRHCGANEASVYANNKSVSLMVTNTEHHSAAQFQTALLCAGALAPTQSQWHRLWLTVAIAAMVAVAELVGWCCFCYYCCLPEPSLMLDSLFVIVAAGALYTLSFVRGRSSSEKAIRPTRRRWQSASEYVTT